MRISIANALDAPNTCIRLVNESDTCEFEVEILFIISGYASLKSCNESNAESGSSTVSALLSSVSNDILLQFLRIAIIAQRAASGRAKPALIRLLEVSAEEFVLLSLQLVSVVVLSVLFALSIPQLYIVVVYKAAKLPAFALIAWRVLGIILNVAQVLGDFSPRTSRPSVALAVKDSHAYFVLYERCSISPLLVLVKKSPKLCMLAFNNRVYRRDFSIFLLRLANQQPAALRDDLPKRLKRSARR